jgi:hypothetical protein
MRKILLVILLLLLIPAVSATQTSKLDVKEVRIMEVTEDVTILVTIYNKNEIDARDISVDFFLGTQRYYQKFPDLNTGEKRTTLFHVPIPEEMRGEQPLKMIIKNDDLFFDKTVNINIEEEEEQIHQKVVQETFWARCIIFWDSLTQISS